MKDFEDLTGHKIGMLTVNYLDCRRNGSIIWDCTCDCGNNCKAYGTNLRKSRSGVISISCGCAKKDRISNLNKKYSISTTSSPEYYSWWQMIYRCHNEKSKDYKNYGGRGIKVCERWIGSFENFIKDMGMKYGEHKTIDRIDVNGDYYPENCKWSTILEQSRNRRVYDKSGTGVRGVCYKQKENKYYAYIGVSKKRVHLGCYETIEEATKAREEGEKKYWSS